jgi:hypothetical protein
MNTRKLARREKLMYSIINMNGWKYENWTASGSKEKRWYRIPQNNKLVLFKLPITLTSKTSSNFNEITGEMWSEKLASDIGEILGFNVHKVDIGSLDINDEVISYYGLDESKLNGINKIYGAMCHSFLSEGLESLVEGADMIMEFDDSYDRDYLKGNKEIYSYQLLLRLFEKNECIDELYKMVIFDTLIGNTDRHQDNFGMVRDEVTNILRFAPFYDNSSSLGRELKKEKIQQMFKDQQAFNAYIFGRKSCPMIYWGDLNGYSRMNFFDFLREAMILSPDIKNHVHVVAYLTDSKIETIVSDVPTIVMSDIHKEFVVRILKLRRDLILREFSV